MALLVVLLILALPFAELAFIVKVAGGIGIVDTLGLLIVVSVVGVFLARRAGLGALERLRRTQLAGTEPSKELTDAALLLLAAALLVLPGFISDIVGLALLLPPVRAGVRTLILRRLRRSSRVVVVSGPGTHDDEIWDVESWEEPQQSRPKGQIGDGQ